MSRKINPDQQTLFNNAVKPEETEMAEKKFNTVNLFDIAAAESVESSLELVRLGNDETAFIPFTPASVSVYIHYCSDTEINGYVICNGPDCVLCRIGRKRDLRLLLPVYLPAAGSVGILPVSKSFRPSALLPQILNVLKAEKPTVMFVVREGAKFTVSTSELKPDVYGGEIVIKAFLEEYNAGNHDLKTVYQKIDDEQLAGIEEIGRMMALKGISCDAGNKRA
jgi:hypothetical protein